MPEHMKSSRHEFPPTEWSKITALREAHSTGRIGLLGQLATAYWVPLRNFLCSQGRSLEDAADLVQDFMAHAIRSDLFARADPERGRFRSLLLTALKNFAINDKRRADARKRRPPGGFAAWDEVAAPYLLVPPLVDTETPELCFHRQWVRTVIARVLQQLRGECQAKGRTASWNIFNIWIVQPELEGVPSVPLLELARKHQFTPREAANSVTTMKRAFRRLLKQEIATYTLTESDAENECRDVLQLLSMGGHS